MARTAKRNKKGPFYVNPNGSLEWRGSMTLYDAPALDGAIIAYVLRAKAMGVSASVALRDLCRNGGAQTLAAASEPPPSAAPPAIETGGLGADL